MYYLSLHHLHSFLLLLLLLLLLEVVYFSAFVLVFGLIGFVCVEFALIVDRLLRLLRLPSRSVGGCVWIGGAFWVGIWAFEGERFGDCGRGLRVEG